MKRFIKYIIRILFDDECSKIISKPGEFTIHDTRGGYCAFCGSIRCNMTCFK